jgi:hypothetical protein
LAYPRIPELDKLQQEYMDAVADYYRWDDPDMKLKAAELMQKFNDRKYGWQAYRRPAFWVKQEM